MAISAATDAQVLGNYIGTDVTGSADLGNSRDGVMFTGQSQGQVAGNLVSGNGGNGVHVTFNGRGVGVAGNSIGVNAAGTSALGNDGDGVRVEYQTSDSVSIGGTSGSGNVISGNGGNGVYIRRAALRLVPTRSSATSSASTGTRRWP